MIGVSKWLVVFGIVIELQHPLYEACVRSCLEISILHVFF